MDKIMSRLPFRKRRDEVKVKTAPKQRPQWANQREFVLTCVGYAVGLGNVWRFPYLCYRSGGGAFLIPYVIMMIVIGFPLLYMEYCFGQYFGVGALSIWNICPLFKGIGAGYVILNALVCIYYNVIIALSLYYLFASFQTNLPWATCTNPWNTELCDELHNAPINATGNVTDTIVGGLNVSSNATYVLQTAASSLNATISNVTQLAKRSPSQEYWDRVLLDNPDGSHDISDIGSVRWHTTLCLFLAWIFVCIFVCKGIKSSGKVVYFTATFPYLMLTVLVIRGATLEGASNGIIYFLRPQWDQLANPEIWFDAATQLFYSTNIAWGGMITMASYNDFKHNCFRDAIFINLVAFFTSLYAGLAVFSVIGYMSAQSGVDVDKVIDSGPGLAFIVYPSALALMPLAPMWSALFFFMLFLLGIGSQMVSFETVITGITDEFPFLRRHRLICVFSLAFVLFLSGLPCVTQGGMWVLNLMDRYAAGFCLLVIAVCECFALQWLYKTKNFCANIKEMLGYVPHVWWRICWQFISPILIVIILVFTFVKYSPVEYGHLPYPGWSHVIGWIMALSSCLPIFIIAAYMLFRAPGDTLREKFEHAIKPEKGAFEGRQDKTPCPVKDDSGNGSEESLELGQAVQSTAVLLESGHQPGHDHHFHGHSKKDAEPDKQLNLLKHEDMVDEQDEDV